MAPHSPVASPPARRGSSRRRGWLLEGLFVPALGGHLLFPVLWIATLVIDGPQRTDWYQFKVVADHFMAGGWDRLYETGPDILNPGFYWLYPPFALYVVAPLAWLTPAAAYIVIVTTGGIALALSIKILRQLGGVSGLPWIMAAILSAPAVATLMIGQNSSLILLCVAAAAAAWTRGRLLHACLMLGLLAFKPNWGIFFGALMLVHGEWKGVAVMLAVVGVLIASSLPLGTGVWADFLHTSFSNAELFRTYPAHKHITLKGFLDAVIGHGPLSTTVWGTVAVGLSTLTILAWRHPGPPLRHLGLATLLAVAANPHASYYDALLLMVPAAAWWAERPRWRPGAWKAVGLLIGIAWCWQQYAFNWSLFALRFGDDVYPPFSIVGVVAALWLLIAVRESIAARPAGCHGQSAGLVSSASRGGTGADPVGR